MMKLDRYNQSEYLNKHDLKDPEHGDVLTIRDFKEVEMRDGKIMLAVLFDECGKLFPLNKTNRGRLMKLCKSDDTDDMIGKKVVLWFDEEVEYGGEPVGGLRFISRRKPVTSGDPDDEIPF